MRFLISARSVGLGKKSLKKITRSLGIGGLAPQHHCFGACKTTTHETEINMADKLVDVIVKLGQSRKKDQPSKPYVVTMLIFQIKRTIYSEKWFNNVITFFPFFSFLFFFFLF